MFDYLIEKLNDPKRDVRLSALDTLIEFERDGAFDKIDRVGDVNNHIHTWYSFSPYSPTKAVWCAHRAGLATAGIMDHDSLAGAEEFHMAGKLAELPVTSGAEIRVSMKRSPYADKRVNNPDQNGIAYMALHAVPKSGRSEVNGFLKSLSSARGERNRQMLANINCLCAPAGIELSYEEDVLPLSKSREGGSVTERHLLFALANKLISEYGRGEKLIDVLEHGLHTDISSKNREWLSAADNPGYAYDVLGVLKGGFVSKFYVDANERECPDVSEAIALAERVGAVSAYAYLGDVGGSVTGDKRPQRFEDEYLDSLIPYLSKLGFNAVTYMPSRNTPAQLERIASLCHGSGLFQISGEDINSPRQSFVSLASRDPKFSQLKTAAYALIGSELLAASDKRFSMFSSEAKAAEPSVEVRAEYYAAAGRETGK